MKDAIPNFGSVLDSCVLRYRFDEGYKVVYPKRRQWEKGNQYQQIPISQVVYTDGSRVGEQGCSGSGVFLEESKIERLHLLIKYASIL